MLLVICVGVIFPDSKLVALTTLTLCDQPGVFWIRASTMYYRCGLFCCRHCNGWALAGALLSIAVTVAAEQLKKNGVCLCCNVDGWVEVLGEQRAQKMSHQRESKMTPKRNQFQCVYQQRFCWREKWIHISMTHTWPLTYRHSDTGQPCLAIGMNRIEIPYCIIRVSHAACTPPFPQNSGSAFVAAVGVSWRQTLSLETLSLEILLLQTLSLQTLSLQTLSL
jgi:hypothetical protein